MKVTAILKGNPDSLGRKTIYIRISEGPTRTFKATTMKVTEEQFQNGQVVHHPKAKLFNDTIRQKIIEAEAKGLSSMKYPDADFRAYAERCLREWSREKKGATLSVYETERDKFLSFTGEIKLSRITPDLLEQYKGHLFNEGYASNTVWKSFKTLRAILRRAKRTKVIEENPFDLFEKVQYRNPDKFYLSPEQMNEVEKFSINQEIPPQLRHVAAWFLLGCYTGLRHSDQVRFDRKKHIVNGRLVMNTAKTYDLVSFPVKGRLLELLERVEYKGLQYSNQKYNEHLKTVASVCGIEENLTGHISRHTFAVRCAEAGISPEVTAKLMGIRSLKTVAVYYKITGHRMDDELSKLY